MEANRLPAWFEEQACAVCVHVHACSPSCVMCAVRAPHCDPESWLFSMRCCGYAPYSAQHTLTRSPSHSSHNHSLQVRMLLRCDEFEAAVPHLAGLGPRNAYLQEMARRGFGGIRWTDLITNQPLVAA